TTSASATSTSAPLSRTATDCSGAGATDPEGGSTKTTVVPFSEVQPRGGSSHACSAPNSTSAMQNYARNDTVEQVEAPAPPSSTLATNFIAPPASPSTAVQTFLQKATRKLVVNKSKAVSEDDWRGQVRFLALLASSNVAHT
ncbi:unnamed protein product, partial [Amoebophrya sp. A120]